MNAAMGTRAGDNGGTGACATFLRREEFAKAGRPELLVFTDVHEDSLTTCVFVLDRDKNWELWAHLPASRHAGSGVISYTDGHAEIHRWRDANPGAGQRRSSRRSRGHRQPGLEICWGTVNQRHSLFRRPLIECARASDNLLRSSRSPLCLRGATAAGRGQWAAAWLYSD